MAKILNKLTMPIASLPETCLQKSSLKSYVNDPYVATVNIVLTLEHGQYVGYIGYPDKALLREEYKNSGNVLYHCNKIRTHDQVARLGDKLDRSTRETLFPESALRVGM
jgi:hypothetical protein